MLARELESEPLPPSIWVVSLDHFHPGATCFSSGVIIAIVGHDQNPRGSLYRPPQLGQRRGYDCFFIVRWNDDDDICRGRRRDRALPDWENADEDLDSEAKCQNEKGRDDEREEDGH